MISAKDLQTITETNNALKAMLPKRQIVNPLNPGNEFGQMNNPGSNDDHFTDDIINSLFESANNNKYPSTGLHESKFSTALHDGKFDAHNPENFYHVIEEHVKAKNRSKYEAEKEAEINKALLERYIQITSKRGGSRGFDFNNLPLPPIDLEVQEIVKRERKKLKNRVAASKCRKKKLEREAQLEVRVHHLKEQSVKLNSIAQALRQQVLELRQGIFEHMNAGCPVVMMQQQQAYYG